MRRRFEDPNQLSFFPQDEDWYTANADRIEDWRVHLKKISEFSHDFLTTFLDDINIDVLFNWSIENCDQELFDFCIKNGCDFLSKRFGPHGNNILHKYSHSSDLKSVKFLVDNRAQALINEYNRLGVLPIHLAAHGIFQQKSEDKKKDCVSLVKYLLHQGSEREHLLESSSIQLKMIELLIDEISKSNVI